MMAAPVPAPAPTTAPAPADVRAAWDDAAEGWNQHTGPIRAWLVDATRRMLDAAQVRPGITVLDVAAGAGDQTADVAARVGRAGSVIATDLSPVILRHAELNASRAGLANVRFQVADAESLEIDAASIDAAVCRLGLMLCPDPARALASVASALRPGARFAAIVFGRPQDNPCIGIVMRTAFEHAGLAPPPVPIPGSLLSLGAPGLIGQCFVDAGFVDVRTESFEAPFRMASAGDYVEFVRAAASPVQQVLAALAPAARDAAWRDIEHRLTSFDTPDGWIGPNGLLLCSGARPTD